jgi:hypothetical protein
MPLQDRLLEVRHFVSPPSGVVKGLRHASAVNGLR